MALPLHRGRRGGDGRSAPTGWERSASSSGRPGSFPPWTEPGLHAGWKRQARPPFWTGQVRNWPKKLRRKLRPLPLRRERRGALHPCSRQGDRAEMLHSHDPLGAGDGSLRFCRCSRARPSGKRENVLPTLGRRTPSSPTNSSGKDGSSPRNILPGKRAGRRTGGESSWGRRRELPRILRMGAPGNRADTRSRSTSGRRDLHHHLQADLPGAEAELLRLTEGIPAVRMVLLASKDPFNPVPGMLGLCSRIFVTEDSVSMVSEAITAGREVFLLRTERQSPGQPFRMQRPSWCENSFLEMLWGIPRFDALFPVSSQGFLKEARYDRLYTSMGTSVSPHPDGRSSARRSGRGVDHGKVEQIVDGALSRSFRKEGIPGGTLRGA